MPLYEPKVRVGAHVVLKDGRSGEIVDVQPDRPAESAYDQDMRVQVKLADGGDPVWIGPMEIEELTPPTGAEDATGA